MPTLLHIDSSPLRDDSISRQLTREFVHHWQRKHPEGPILRRDLARLPLPVISGEWIHASFIPEEARTGIQRELLVLSDRLIGDLLAADEYVIGLPMHNFTVGASLRLWIDQLVRVNKTFAYVDGKSCGLLQGKKANFMIASGGVCAPGTEAAACDFAEPYLRTVFGYMGVRDVSFVKAEGTVTVKTGKIGQAEFLGPHLERIRACF
jgi:FMN-dependent NADH-azoreductase